MAEKIPLTVSEVKNSYTDFRVFHVSLEALYLLKYTTFDLAAFNNAGYLTRLLKNFKQAEKVCYLLFSCLTWPVEGRNAANTNNVREAIKSATSYLTIYEESPVSGRLKKMLGRSIYLLILDNTMMHKIHKILEAIESMGTWSYFIFGDEPDKDSLFSRIEDFYKNNSLGKKSILDLRFETIKYGSEGFWEGYEFEIYTKRFDLEGICDLLSASLDRDKIEVVKK
ncbi:MAG: hypothetical protein V1893_01210 [Candidatus Omnitrophota bacterium]